MFSINEKRKRLTIYNQAKLNLIFKKEVATLQRNSGRPFVPHQFNLVIRDRLAINTKTNKVAFD